MEQSNPIPTGSSFEEYHYEEGQQSSYSTAVRAGTVSMPDAAQFQHQLEPQAPYNYEQHRRSVLSIPDASSFAKSHSTNYGNRGSDRWIPSSFSNNNVQTAHGTQRADQENTPVFYQDPITIAPDNGIATSHWRPLNHYQPTHLSEPRGSPTRLFGPRPLRPNPLARNRLFERSDQLSPYQPSDLTCSNTVPGEAAPWTSANFAHSSPTNHFLPYEEPGTSDLPSPDPYHTSRLSQFESNPYYSSSNQYTQNRPSVPAYHPTESVASIHITRKPADVAIARDNNIPQDRISLGSEQLTHQRTQSSQSSSRTHSQADPHNLYKLPKQAITLSPVSSFSFQTTQPERSPSAITNAPLSYDPNADPAFESPRPLPEPPSKTLTPVTISSASTGMGEKEEENKEEEEEEEERRSTDVEPGSLLGPPPIAEDSYSPATGGLYNIAGGLPEEVSTRRSKTKRCWRPRGVFKRREFGRARLRGDSE